MNTSDYSAWMERAFLYVEGTLLRRAAEGNNNDHMEDFVRQALIDGLKAAKGALADLVSMEVDVPWNAARKISSSRMLSLAKDDQSNTMWAIRRIMCCGSAAN